MALPKELQDRIGAFLRGRGVQGCVACGFDGAFLYGDIYTLPATMGVYQQGNPTVQGKGVVPIACPNCGHLMLFDTKTLPGVL